METFEAVRTILAVRSYQDRPVPEAVLREVVEAGQLTASARNRQPWHFIVVQDRDTLKRLGGMATTGPYIAGAAAAIVVAISETRNSVSDASRAIQSMLLTAWSHGVGGNWVGTGPNGIDGLNDLSRHSRRIARAGDPPARLPESRPWPRQKRPQTACPKSSPSTALVGRLNRTEFETRIWHFPGIGERCERISAFSPASALENVDAD